MLRGASPWSLLPAAALLLTLIHAAWPQRSGPVALFAAVAPVAYGLIVLALVPLSVLRRDAALAAVMAVAAVGASLVYHQPVDIPPATGGTRLTLVTWNLHGTPPAEVGLAAALERWRPDVLILQEAMLSDAETATLLSGMEVLAFPEAATPPGMVLASRFRVLDSGELERPAGAWDRPRVFWMRVATPSGPLTVVGVHLSVPFPLASLPCPYCPDLRDAQVAALADFVGDRVSAGERVAVAGDFNLSEREVAYRDLSQLTDAGSGLTWRPFPIDWLPPLLRLDYVFIGPGLESGSTATDCGLSQSDHCPLAVELAIP